MKKYGVLIILQMISVHAQAQTLSNHYQINVEVDPAKRFIKSHCSLHFVADKKTEEITYWMNDAFQPIEVNGEDIDSVWVTDAQGLPAQIREVHIRFKNTLEKEVLRRLILITRVL